MEKLKLYDKVLFTDMERYVLNYDCLKDAFMAMFDEWRRCRRDYEASLESVIDNIIDSGKLLFDTKLSQGIVLRENLLYSNMTELIANSSHYKALLEAKHQEGWDNSGKT